MKVVPDSERDSNKKIISKSYKSLTVKKNKYIIIFIDSIHMLRMA